MKHPRIAPYIRVRRSSAPPPGHHERRNGGPRGRLLGPAEIERRIGTEPDCPAYKAVMHLDYLHPPAGELSDWWNVMDGRGRALERFRDPRAKLLHFTHVKTQPWYDPSHPARPVWEEYLIEALAADVVEPMEIEAACERFQPSGHRPNGMHPYWRRHCRA